MLVGYKYPIGVDIVSRSQVLSQLSPQELSSLFSNSEIEGLLEVDSVKRNDVLLLNVALKEAYMKFTGEPDWDNLASIEFVDLQIPAEDGKGVTPAASGVYVSGQSVGGYTECHMFDETYFIVVYTSEPPTDIGKFVHISFKDLLSAGTSRSSRE